MGTNQEGLGVTEMEMEDGPMRCLSKFELHKETLGERRHVSEP